MSAKAKIDESVAIKLYRDGYTADQIASHFGTKSGETICRIIRQYDRSNRDKIRSLWKAGWSVNRIMKECKCTEEDIKKAI